MAAALWRLSILWEILQGGVACIIQDTTPLLTICLLMNYMAIFNLGIFLPRLKRVLRGCLGEIVTVMVSEYRNQQIDTYLKSKKRLKTASLHVSDKV